MANVAKNSRENPVKSSPRLSSGIMGMKFMQKDESSSPSPSNQQEPETTETSKIATESDPGAWFSPFAKKTTRVSIARNHNNNKVGYSDLYAPSTGAQGRRVYGQQPKTVDPEEMVKSYEKDSKANTRSNNKKKAKKGPVPDSRKRLSDSEGSRSTSKRRKS